MPRIECLVFDQPGPDNTQDTLAIAKQRGDELGIRQVVVATSTGQTALEAAKVFSAETKLVGVTLHRGIWEKYVAPDPEIVAEAEGLGVQFLTCPHALMGSLDTAVQSRFGGLPPGEFVSYVYYTFCQGVKVAVEVVLMAADAALLDTDQDVIGIAGTDTGADTALVITPSFSFKFFDIRIREVLAKPR